MLDSNAGRRARLLIAASALVALILAAPAYRANAQSAPGSVPLGPSSAAPPPGAAPTGPMILAPNDPRNPLHLTKEQQQQRFAVIQQYEPQIQALLRDPKLTVPQKKAKLNSIVAAVNTRLEAMLSPSQRATNEKLKKQMAARQAMMTQRQAEMQQMGKRFESTLTPDQKKKLTALRTATQQQFLQIQADKSLTPQQKQQKIMALGTTYTAKVNDIYTPAQRAMLTQMRAQVGRPLGGPAGH